MSNINNSAVLTMNKGTAKSGWWNPDHAARMAAGKIDWAGEHLNGNGKAYCAAVLSNVAIDNALRNSSPYHSDAGIKGTGTSLMKDIREQVSKDAELSKGQLWQKEEFLGSKQDTTISTGQADIIAGVVKNTDYIAEKLSDYAASSGSSSYKERSIPRIRKDIKDLSNQIRINNTIKNVVYSDSNNKQVELQRVFQTNLKTLDDYAQEMKQLRV